MAKNARLLYADSERSADLFYATGVFVPDPFLWFEIDGEATMIVSPLEYSRAKEAAKPGVRVLGYDEARKQFKLRSLTAVNQIAGISKTYGVRKWRVPQDFPLGPVQRLARRQIAFQTVTGAFFPEREFKRPDEVAALQDGVRLAEHGLLTGLGILEEATISGDDLIWNGAPLTAEILRGEIDASICKRGGVASHTIVAPGPMGAEPHNAGSGPIRPHSPIVIDIFPRVTATGYFGDLTRTVVKGKAADIVHRAYEAVRNARDRGIEMIAAGVNGKTVHQAGHTILRDAGFKTDLQSATPSGFIHGTGHGLGLEIHEAPRINRSDYELRPGHVVTVEPGLYYPEWGGVRLEDVVVVEEDGCTNLTSVPNVLEIA